MRFNIEDFLDDMMDWIANKFNSSLPIFIRLFASNLNPTLLPPIKVIEPKPIVFNEMKDYGITAVWGDDYLSLREEFKGEFNRIFSEKNQGIHTVYLCLYERGVVIVEAIKVLVYAEVPLFFFSDCRLVVNLDKDMYVSNATLDESADLFLRMFYSDMIDIFEIGPICHPKGYTWNIFTLLSDKTISNADNRYDYDRIPIEILTLSEEEMIKVALDFTLWKKEKFLLEIETTVMSEDDVMPSENNPFESRFYMEATNNGMRTEKVRVGDA
jgi:hypothetical protein